VPGHGPLSAGYMGRGPKDIRAHLIEDILIVRLQGVLTAAEQHPGQYHVARKSPRFVQTGAHPSGSNERPAIEAMIVDITGMKVISLRYDISTVTGEEFVVLTLNASPLVREGKRSK